LFDQFQVQRGRDKNEAFYFSLFLPINPKKNTNFRALLTISTHNNLIINEPLQHETSYFHLFFAGSKISFFPLLFLPS
jgi:hypothetical protein